MRVEVAAIEYLVEQAGFLVKPEIEEDRIGVPEEVNSTVNGAPGVELDEEVNQNQADGMRRQQKRPERHSRAVQQKDNQPHQDNVALRSIVNEGIAPE